MDVYVVDTNLLFSSFLKPDGDISQFILSAAKYEVTPYAPKYLQVEIDRHRAKILALANYSPKELDVLVNRIYRCIRFVDDDLIRYEYYVRALRLIRDVNPDDVAFVALNSLLGKTLWTGDVALYEGLKAKGYTDVIMFSDIKSKYGL